MIFGLGKKIESKSIPRPVVLAILDGWGISPIREGNSIRLAKTPVMDELEKFYPKTSLQAAGIAVGLPWGEVGNSEVGHTNLGSGKVIYQDLPRISRTIENGSFFKNKVLLQAITHAKQNNSALHLMGLVSVGGVHSHIEHLYALIELLRQNPLQNIYLHIFTDGRDSPAQAAKKFISDVEEKIKSANINLKIASLSGRYYAMDRDKHWDRIELCYKAIIGESIEKETDAIAAIDKSYNAGITDEFIKPLIIVSSAGNPVAKINDNDAIIFFNFRPDRAVEITRSFTDPAFDGFITKKFNNLYFVGFTLYDKKLKIDHAFPEESIEGPIALVISEKGKRQLHVAETEKYAHVTYFFNGGREKPFPGEDRIFIPSPPVATYDLAPEMSARKITEALLPKINEGLYDFIVINFANPDMVGHTGVLPACIQANEFVDFCLGQVVNTTIAVGGALFVTADHGNAEEKINPQTGKVNKEHTTNPVPFIYVAGNNRKAKPDPTQFEQILPSGALADVSPTVLELMQIEKHSDMTGYSLLQSLL